MYEPLSILRRVWSLGFDTNNIAGFVTFHGSGAWWHAQNCENDFTTQNKSTLARLRPPGADKSGRGSAKGMGWILENNKKEDVFKNVHFSRAPGPFWSNRDADRTLITTVGCVVCRGCNSGQGRPKVGPVGLPEGARRAPRTPKGTLNTTVAWVFEKHEKITHFENAHPSRAPGPFWPNRTPTER